MCDESYHCKFLTRKFNLGSTPNQKMPNINHSVPKQYLLLAKLHLAIANFFLSFLFFFCLREIIASFKDKDNVALDLSSQRS